MTVAKERLETKPIAPRPGPARSMPLSSSREPLFKSQLRGGHGREALQNKTGPASELAVGLQARRQGRSHLSNHCPFLAEEESRLFNSSIGRLPVILTSVSALVTFTVLSASAICATLGSLIEPRKPLAIVSNPLSLSAIAFACSALSLASVAVRSMPNTTSIVPNTMVTEENSGIGRSLDCSPLVNAGLSATADRTTAAWVYAT